MIRHRLVPFLTAVVATAALAACGESAERKFARGLERAVEHERAGRLHEATREYDALLGGDLSPSDRADVRFRLARCRIAGGDLNGALETLDDLVGDDVKPFQLDLGPLYLELGDKYFEKGDRKKAQLAWQLGRSVSPSRIVEFNKRIERLLPPESSEPSLPSKPPPSGTNPGAETSNGGGA